MRIQFTIPLILTMLILITCSADTGSNSKHVKSSKERLNRLANEKSPYLLQHADNPVDWYPWGEEAFKKAKALDRPIFLSIGYSTCHWCHVMEHESFEDEEVAKLLNENYICIKVDREERPEIDHVYMSVCQAMTGRGGWPLTIFMTPDKEPYFAGTYFPKQGRGNRPGMMQLLPSLTNAWINRRDQIRQSIDQIKNYLIKSNTTEIGDPLSRDVLNQTLSQLVDRFDRDKGGFGLAPKFPSPHNLLFLLRYYHMMGDTSALTIVETTLQHMRMGGIFDQIGFGFHRYSTDKNWLVPHFEKMLYDQALISMAYIESYQITKKKEYAQIASDIFTYVLRDLTSPKGCFYSAEDADSEGEEGKFYLWTDKEIQSILGTEDAAEFNTLYNIKSNGNFHEETTHQLNGTNIPYLTTSLTAVPDEFINNTRQKLFNARKKRIHPLKDDKILTDWNGLMIAALSKGAVALDSDEYLKAASKAADFILINLKTETGRLLKRYRKGDADLIAHLDDYIFLIWGLLELYEAGFEVRYLKEAITLAEITVEDFWDESGGGFFLGSDNAEKLIVRSKTGYDGAIPSGNSIAVGILYRLSRITGDIKWTEMADKTLRVFSNDIKKVPIGYSGMLTGYLFDVNSPKEVVIVGDPQTQATQEFVKAIHSEYQPNKILLFKDSSKKAYPLSATAPWTDHQIAINGEPTAYVCKNFTCNLPTTDIQKALKFIYE